MDSTDKAWADYSDRFRRDVLPKLMDSAVFVSIGTTVGGFDVRQATELGAALLMGKPVLLIIPRGCTIANGLRRAADEVVDDWDGADNAADHERLAAALKRLRI